MAIPTRPAASVNLRRATERPPIRITKERHPLSTHFGDMPDDQWEELKADIKANKLQESIVLYEGKILDGWHRYKALCALGRPLNESNSYEFDPSIDGASAETWVHSKNLFRRQLTAEERVRIAAKHLGYAPKGRGGVRTEGPTLQDVAAEAKVSTKTAQRALGAKGHDVSLPPKVTLQSLEKKKAALEKQLQKVIADIAALAPGRRSRK